MNTSGEVADLMVKEGLMITEEALKLTGLGAKNLAAIIIALMKEDNKMQGETNLKKLLKADKKLCILQIEEKDIKKFNEAAKKYGVLFTVVKDKENNSGLCDIIAKQEDVTQLNYIMEKLGYAAPVEEIEPEPEKENTEEKAEDKTDGKPEREQAKENEPKKPLPRAKENQQEKESMKHGDTDRTDSRTDKKPSVKKKIEDIKEEQKKGAKKEPEKEKNGYLITAPTNKKKKPKKKSKKKSKSR